MDKNKKYESDKELSHNADMLRNQIMFSAETYYNVLHYIVHKIIAKELTDDEIEDLIYTVTISKLNNEDIANTFFRIVKENK